ncbi:MAG: hypothetical protein K2H97_09255, partial [Prevotella sp.]|nr:hypothetical protein [Prevotella sp.]
MDKSTYKNILFIFLFQPFNNSIKVALEQAHFAVTVYKRIKSLLWFARFLFSLQKSHLQRLSTYSLPPLKPLPPLLY